MTETSELAYNPNLYPPAARRPRRQAAKGEIERPREVINLVWQSRANPPGAYESRLADTMIAAFDSGVEQASDLADYLNTRAVLDAKGKPWTARTLEAELARLAI